MFSDLMHDGYIEVNPTSKLRLPKLETREPKPFNHKEISRILDEMKHESVRNYFALAIATGMRTSELIALTWNKILWDRAQIIVDKARVRGELKPPKSKASTRYIDLDKAGIEILSSQKSISTDIEEVFFDPSTQSAWRDDKKLRVSHWYPALLRAGVQRREPYQTRHTFASMRLSENKEAPIYIASQMGHSDCSMIYKKYARWIRAT
jgi:integrase